MKQLKIIAAGALLALASACTVISSNVESYSTLPPEAAPRPVQITAAPWMDGDSLAFRQRAGELAGLLAAKGYASAGAGAPLVAAYAFETQAPIQQVRTRREPVYETRTVERADGSTSTDRHITGYRTVQDTKTVFPRIVRLDITERATGAKVYEGIAHSQNVCQNSPNIIRLMTEALVQDFPASREGRVTLSNDTAC